MIDAPGAIVTSVPHVLETLLYILPHTVHAYLEAVGLVVMEVEGVLLELLCLWE